MRRNFLLTAILILLMISSCQGLPGTTAESTQEQGPDVVTQTLEMPRVDLEYGDTVSQTLSSRQGDLWTFSAEAGDVVTIAMISGEEDAFLALFGPTMEYIMADDDGGGGDDAAIIDFPLPVSGIYTINASSFGPDSGGSYSLSLARSENSRRYEAAGGGELNVGDVASGFLVAATGDAWTFAANADDMISISARSEDFDAVLVLYTPDLKRWAWDDDSLGGYDPLILALTLPGSGRYTVVVRSYTDDATGAYTLSSAWGAELPRSAPSPSEDVGAILYGETLESALPGTQGEQWYFDANAGDAVTISATSTEFDTFLALFSPTAGYITCDDDGGEGYNSRIEGISLAESGTYYIDVFSYGGNPTGTYTLALESSSLTGAVSSAYSGEIGYGSSTKQALGAWVGDEWTFWAEAGDEIRITMESEDFDTALDLYDTNLLRIMSDIGSGNGFNSAITARLPMAGTYTLVARAFSPGGAGEYTLSLTR